jgi:hypothetical protein
MEKSFFVEKGAKKWYFVEAFSFFLFLWKIVEVCRKLFL